MALRLRSLLAENYKSLHNVLLEFKELSVFLGANEVGKSNIFDALRFIKDRVELGFVKAIDGRGGVELCTWRGTGQRSQKFHLKAEFDDLLEYALTVGTDDAGLFADDQLRAISDGSVWLETRRFQTTFYRRGRTGTMTTGMDTDLLKQLGQPQQPEQERAFVEAVRGWHFYNFMPAMMRSSGPARRQERLDEYGENFSSWLHNIQIRHRKNFQEIIAVVKDAIQTVSDLAFDLTESSTINLLVEEEGLDGLFPIETISDGALRFLAHVAVLRQPVAPTLLCLEEPENYIHPRLLDVLRDEIKTAALRFPILISTHNPLLVDKFDPTAIVIVERNKEGTFVVTVRSRDDLQKLIEEMQLELGEIWYSGALGGVRSKLD